MKMVWLRHNSANTLALNPKQIFSEMYVYYYSEFSVEIKKYHLNTEFKQQT